MANITLSGYYQNVCGLRTKTHRFYSQVAQSHYDFICITESWLNKNFYDGEIFDSRYLVYRCDRSAEATDLERGGGAMVAVHRDYQPVRQNWPCPPAASSECVWVSIPLSNNSRHKSLHICCVYIPQGRLYTSALINFFEIFCSRIVTEHSDDVFLITGDFNVSDAEWSNSSCRHMCLDNGTEPTVEPLQEFLCFTGLQQFNSSFNINYRLLDLILSNRNCAVISSPNPLIKEDRHHKAVEIELSLDYSPTLQPAPTVRYCFFNSNFDEINRELSKIDWFAQFSGRSLQECTLILYTILNRLIDAHVPKRPLRTSINRPPWHTKPLRRLLNEKRKYHKLWKTYGNPLDRDSFRCLRKRVDK